MTNNKRKSQSTGFTLADMLGQEQAEKLRKLAPPSKRRRSAGKHRSSGK